MAKIIKFPFNKAVPPVELEVPPPHHLQMESVLRGMLSALRRGTIKPERLFIVFEQGDVCSYLNIEFEPDQLTKAVDLVLQDIARGYDSD